MGPGYIDRVTEILEPLVTADSICIDVGANVGRITLAMARRGAHVYAIEPDSAAYAALVQNLAQTFNVTTENALVGVPGSRRTFLPDPQSAFSTSVAENMSGGSGGLPGQKRTCVSIDEFAQRRDIKRVDIMKIDVEGAELEVLQGAACTLAHHKPVCVVEFNAHCFMNFGDVNPRRAIDQIVGIFPFVWRVVAGAVIEPIRDPFRFTHDNVVYRRGIDDLLCAFDERPPKVLDEYRRATRSLPSPRRLLRPVKKGARRILERLDGVR